MRDPFETVPLRSRYGVLSAAIVIALLVWLGITNSSALGAVGVLFFFFVVMIGMHELGHFVFAKRAGMKVSEFFIGFGPRLWSVQRGETEYGVKALPLGGYCKIVGMTNLEEVPAADEPRAFRNATFWGKATTLVAGPASHFVLAFMMMWAVLAFHGDLLRARAIPTVSAVAGKAIVGTDSRGKAIEVETPAHKAGLRAGDRLHAINRQRIDTWKQAEALIHAHGKQTITILVDRGRTTLTLHATLLAANPDSGKAVGFLGITPGYTYPHPGVLAALSVTPARMWETGRETVSALGSMFSPSGVSKYFDNFSDAPAKTKAQLADRQAHRFISPVGVGRIAYDAVDAGWVTVFGLLISINFFIGLLNLLPLIPFDGGHLAVAAYESIASRIQRRRVYADFNKLMPIAIATLAVFGFIFLSSLFLDIAHPIRNPF